MGEEVHSCAANEAAEGEVDQGGERDSFEVAEEDGACADGREGKGAVLYWDDDAGFEALD